MYTFTYRQRSRCHSRQAEEQNTSRVLIEHSVMLAREPWFLSQQQLALEDVSGGRVCTDVFMHKKPPSPRGSLTRKRNFPWFQTEEAWEKRVYERFIGRTAQRDPGILDGDGWMEMDV